MLSWCPFGHLTDYTGTLFCKLQSELLLQLLLLGFCLLAELRRVKTFNLAVMGRNPRQCTILIDNESHDYPAFNAIVFSQLRILNILFKKLQQGFLPAWESRLLFQFANERTISQCVTLNASAVCTLRCCSHCRKSKQHSNDGLFHFYSIIKLRCKGTEITRGIQRFSQNGGLWGRFAEK